MPGAGEIVAAFLPRFCPILARDVGLDRFGSVRIATWNVNSLKQRLPRLLLWLDERQPDVVCLQETKLTDESLAELLGDELADRSYAVAAHGEAAWNGVAILSRVGLEDVVTGLAGAPGFPHPEARAVSGTCGGIRVVSVYVPNGRVPGSDHYAYKLAWLAALRDVVAAAPAATVVCGDMNVAPTDDDVFDPAAYVGRTHVTPPERAALNQLQEPGLRDVVREGWPTGAGGLGGPAGAQGPRPQRSRAGDRRSGRGAGRRHRAGRATALGPA